MPKIEWDIKLNFGDVLIRPKRSKLKSRSQVVLEREFTFVNSFRKWRGIPVIVANMDTTGTFEMARALAPKRCVVAIHKHYSLEAWKQFAAEYPSVLPHVAVSSGTSTADFAKLCAVVDSINVSDKVDDSEITRLSSEPPTKTIATDEKTDGDEASAPVRIFDKDKVVDPTVDDPPPRIRFLCLDVANGYSEHFVDYVKQVRSRFPSLIIIAGNVVTGEMTEQLILNGADIVKVGIGPGSVCTTRKKTGVGYPQLSAVLECADAAHGLGGCIISDGGCTMPGDFSKAFGGGADFVMAGGMFAGHDESGGDLVTNTENGRQYKEFYGMSSSHAMSKHSGGVADYRASEGKYVLVPYKGPVMGTINTILGGVRSTCTYVGASKLKELSKRTTFIRVSSGGHHNVVFGDEKDSQPKSSTLVKSPVGGATATSLSDAASSS